MTGPLAEKSIFLAALEKGTAEERAAYLDQACAANPRLRADIEALLVAHDRLGSLPAQPLAALGATVDEPIREGPGTMIGPYKLLEQIGEGGFGVVFMAEQTEPVRRKVALKVLKPGMDTRQVIARFEAERQALAIMDHPNVAKILDGGATPSGRPFFAMELVKGVPVTDFCDQNHLTPRQRLELFIPVCQAVQHAHQKGIIHRDLKPSNVLVSMHEGVPVPMVIDFGVAKALGQELTDKTLFTAFAQMIGTPLYMSPEQAGGSPDIDTRSDIYSLGVLLYELLTGTTPFDKERFQKAAYDEIRRIIREEDPPKPSTRLSESKDSLPSISAQRHMEPAKLTKLVRGELDWIVMKALEKDRNRRYETANGFAMDVQRYLSDDPVRACPPSLGYRLRKFARRNKGPVLGVSLLVLTLVAGIVGTTIGLVEARGQRNTAEAAAVAERQAKEAATDAEREKTKQLALSRVREARAKRLSREVGQRFASLETLTKAIDLFRSRGELDQHLLELRNEVIACLALPDLRVAKEWDLDPQWSVPLAFDPKLEHYVVADNQPVVTYAVNQGHLSVRRVADHQEVARLPGFKVQVVAAAFSPDGKFLAVHYEQGQRHNYVWHVSRREAIIKVEFCGGQLPNFSPDGRLVAIPQRDNSIRLYELPSGKPTETVLRPGLPVSGVFFHPDSRKLAVISGRSVQIHAVDDGKELGKFQHPPAAEVRRLAWRDDGRPVATACLDGQVYLWDMKDLRQPIQVLKGHQGAVVGVTFSHAGDLLFTRGWDQARLWNPGTGQQVFSKVPNIASQLSPDDRQVAFGSDGAKVWLSELAAGRECRTFVGHHGDYNDGYWRAALSPDGRLLASVARDGFRLWDPFATREADKLLAHQPLIRCGSVGFFPDGSVLTAGQDGLLRWPLTADAETGRLVLGPARALGALAGPDMGAVLSADRRTVCVARQGQALVFAIDNPDRTIRLQSPFLAHPAISPDGRWVATGTWGAGSGVKVWNAHTGALAHDLPVKGAAWPRFSPDGKWLVTTSNDGVLLWSRKLEAWEPGLKFPAPGAVGLLPAFSPDGNVLAVPESRSLVRLIDLATGREFASLPTKGGPCCFSPDGSQLVTGSENHALQVWDLRLIREQLATMGLDWHLPSYPQAPAVDARKPLRVRVELGELFKPLTREERARRKIEDYRRRVAANQNDADAANGLAWHYATAPESLREPDQALTYAQKAVQLAPENPQFQNTLGVAYYRAGRDREAKQTLKANLQKSEDRFLAWDLYFLAMSCQQLGETERARDYYTWAVRWSRAQQGLSPEHAEELRLFQAEAEKLIKGASN